MFLRTAIELGGYEIAGHVIAEVSNNGTSGSRSIGIPCDTGEVATRSKIRGVILIVIGSAICPPVGQ